MKIFCVLSPVLLAVAAASGNSHLRQRRNAKQVAPTSFRSVSELPTDPDVQKVLDLVQDTIWQRELLQASSSNTTCTNPMDPWLRGHIDEMGLEVYNWLEEKNVFLMPFVYKVLFDRNEQGEYIGVNGAETEELIARQRSANAFWESVDSDGTLDTHNIKLLGVHGTILQNKAALGTLLLLFGEPLLHIPYWVSAIQSSIETNVPNGYNNPLFTANAMAFPSLADLLGVEFGEGFVPDVILMGDGIIDFVKDAGLGRDGPDFVHAHEYGHQMQFDIDAYDDAEHLPVPEQTRRTELMADALATYFLAHDNGGNLSEGHIQELHEGAFALGDCEVASDGHHGTPLQRECAAMWGASQAVADNASGAIMHPSTFRHTFDTVLDEIIAVDASVCQTVASRF